ncbi:MAG: hypothetical protein BGO78_06050 [Chloroflexi bacterium 44-23]|nr:MAG: hypothetical protein BGO78_06050 [Chloroflexi bacterium 44-23]
MPKLEIIPSFHELFDCLILVNPSIQILMETANKIKEENISVINISQELGGFLLNISAMDRSRSTQNWMVDKLASHPHDPILCVCPDLLFDPTLQIDPFALFRQIARIKHIVVMWPGNFSSGILSYAVPEHHHFRTWKITDTIINQPVVLIRQFPTSQGA